jgi:hypothetical protein
MHESAEFQVEALESTVRRLATSWHFKEFGRQTVAQQFSIARNCDFKRYEDVCLFQEGPKSAGASVEPSRDSIKGEDCAIQIIAAHGWGNDDSPLSLTVEDFKKALGWLRLSPELLRRLPAFNSDVPHFWEHCVTRKGEQPSNASSSSSQGLNALHLAFKVDLRGCAYAMCLFRYDYDMRQMKGLIFECQSVRPSQIFIREHCTFVERILNEERLRLSESPLQLITSIFAALESRLQLDISVFCTELLKSEGLINVTKRTEHITKCGFTLGSSDDGEINARLYDSLIDLGQACSRTEVLLRFCDDFEKLLRAAYAAVPNQNSEYQALLRENASTMRRLHVDKTEIAFAQTRLQSKFAILHNLISHHHSQLNANIAMACKSNSRAMRSISFLSLIFLPTTFVSAMFSTTVFNFQAWPNDANVTGDGGTGQVVSPAWWIYMVCCILLTAVTSGIWYLWNRRAERFGAVRHSRSSSNASCGDIEQQLQQGSIEMLTLNAYGKI